MHDSKNGSGAIVLPYANKDAVATYLAEINKDKKVLEYTLFQPSIFLDYFAHPHPLSPGLITWPFFADFHSRRAMVLDAGDTPFYLTAISDVSQVLLRALDDEQEWPRVGGIQGTRVTINELVALGKELRGGEWQVEYVRGEDVARGELKTSWVPVMTHPVIPMESREAYAKEFVVTFLSTIRHGSWDVSGEFNQRYPEYKFWSAREYLTEAWKGKP